MDEGSAGDVDATRRLRGDQEFRLALEFARDREALLIAAGEAAGGIAECAEAHGQPLERPRGLGVDVRAPQKAEARESGSRSRPATKLSRQRRGETKTFLAAIGADIADPRSRGSARSGARSGRRRRNASSPATGTARPAAQATSSSCPLPPTPATPTISPGRISRSTGPKPLESKGVAPTRPRAREQRLAVGRAGRGSIGGLDGFADHGVRERRDACRGRGRSRDDAAGTHHGDRVRAFITSSSLWLMKRIVRPSAFSLRISASSSSICEGARTAVGSSRIRTSAPR